MSNGNSPPAKSGIFGWFSGDKAANSSAIVDEPVEPLKKQYDIPKRQPRSRKDSSSLTHDEALNLSRANSSRPSEVAGSPLSPELAPQRGRSNSRFEKLGLMAAYSAGPSSF